MFSALALACHSQKTYPMMTTSHFPALVPHIFSLARFSQPAGSLVSFNLTVSRCVEKNQSDYITCLLGITYFSFCCYLSTIYNN